MSYDKLEKIINESFEKKEKVLGEIFHSCLLSTLWKYEISSRIPCSISLKNAMRIRHMMHDDLFYIQT